MNFGENLRIIRKNQKMSQEDLAEKVGVSRQSISKWENGDAYPEMNNILELCKIFNCHINDLVHENMKDIDSLDKEIKIKVVKLKADKQRKVKLLSKIIYKFSKLGEIVCLFGLIICGILAIILPVAILNCEIKNDKLLIFGNVVDFEENTENLQDIEEIEIRNNSDVYEKNFLINKIENNPYSLIVQIEIFLVIFGISIFLFKVTVKNVGSLFKNIYCGETPFTIQNLNHIKKFTYYLIASYLVSMFASLCCSLFFKVESTFTFNESNIILILCLFCISYIFEYGCEIQKDSLGVMYDGEDSKDD